MASRMLCILVVSLLCVSGPVLVHAVKILEKAKVCPQKAQKGDDLQIHYVGKLKDGTMFDETFKIGRPQPMTLGNKDVVEGFDEGLVGMCVGEVRRLTVPAKLGYGEAGKGDKVPPGSTTIFEVTLVALNGKFLHDMEAEAKEAQAAVDLVLATNAGKAASPFCDACNTFVEEFFESWMNMLVKQNSKIEQKDGGSSVPALTYNDETEATVQGFCTNKTFSRITDRRFAAHIQPACERIMLSHKREIVGKFLATQLHGREIPDKKDTVCHDMVHACPLTGKAMLHSDCDFCQASVQDIAFEVRRRSTIPAVSLEKQMYEFMSWICMRTYYRHRFKGADLQEFCDDMMDEHAKAIHAQLIKGADGSKTWRQVERAVCVEVTDSCSDWHYEGEL